jgi:hypothetical protein
VRLAPDEVGVDVAVKLDGKITTPHHKPVSSCRATRQFHLVCRRLGESYTCKKLKDTLQVDYAPAAAGP